MIIKARFDEISRQAMANDEAKAAEAARLKDELTKANQILGA